MTDINRVIISGGGTGGHIFPALSIGKALQKRYPNIEILYVGAEGRMEMERVPQAGFPIKGLPVEGLSRNKIWHNFKVLKKALVSLIMARDIIKEFKPQVVIGVGGYASLPTLKAAQSLNIPTLIQEQNSYAGLTNKFLARRAKKICVAYPDMDRFFKKDRIVLTGNPLREQIEFLDVDRQEALAYFGFNEELKGIVLVVGGSLGARTINESIATKLDEWQKSGYALIWQTGKGYHEQALEQLKAYNFPIYCNAFIDRMDFAYALSDLVVSRAGASSISELCVLGKASVLVPSPNVSEDHQTKNAMALSTRGAAVLIADKDAREELSKSVFDLMANQGKRTSLSEQISLLAERNSADRIVDEIEKLV